MTGWERLGLLRNRSFSLTLLCSLVWELRGTPSCQAAQTATAMEGREGGVCLTFYDPVSEKSHYGISVILYYLKQPQRSLKFKGGEHRLFKCRRNCWHVFKLPQPGRGKTKDIGWLKSCCWETIQHPKVPTGRQLQPHIWRWKKAHQDSLAFKCTPNTPNCCSPRRIFFL